MILNKMELQKLKSLIKNQEILYNKLIKYADFAVDPQIKQIFNKAASDSLKSKQKLAIFLKNK